MLKKKSQLFMFDMIFSIVIVIISLSLIFLYYSDNNDNSNIYDLNKNILNGFTNTLINDLNSPEIRDLFKNNKIKNIDNTVAQQVITFYAENEKDYAQNLTRIFVSDYIDKEMNFLFLLRNESNGPLEYVLFNATNRESITFNDAAIASMNQRMIFSYKDEATFYGPYVLEVRIWM